MDFSSDELRRDAQATEPLHHASISPMRNALGRVFSGDPSVPGEMKSQLALNGLTRRRFLTIGGVSVLGATILAACGSDAKRSSSTTKRTSSTTTVDPDMTDDVLILRTASSIEALAVAAYQTAIDSGLVKTAAIAEVAKLFQAQHREHAQLFIGATKKAGGTPFDTPNPAVLAQLQPTIDGLKDEMGILKLAYDLEVAAAQTYQSTVGVFSDATLNQAVMSVGGVEARHVAALAKALALPAAAKAFQTIEMAIPAGTGVK